MVQTKRSKREMASNIRGAMLGSAATDIKKEASTNVQVAKNITQVSVAIEKLTEEQMSIFEDMISELQKIPKSIQERERQNKTLQEKLIKAIVDLDKRIEEEGDATKKEELQKQREELKNVAGELESTQDPRQPRSLGEAIGQRYGVNLEAMREAGGGIKGMYAGFKTNLKAGLGVIRNPFKDFSPQKKSLEERISDEKAAQAASEEIGGNFRAEAVRARLEGTPEYLIAQKDAETGEFYRTGKKGQRIDAKTAAGEVNPQFDPGGLGTSSAMILDRETGLPIEMSDSDGGKSPSAKRGSGAAGSDTVLTGIAGDVRAIRDILKDSFGADKNENIDPAQEGLAATTNTIESGSGSDIESAAAGPSFGESFGGGDSPSSNPPSAGGGLLSGLVTGGLGAAASRLFRRGGARAAGRVVAKEGAEAAGRQVVKRAAIRAAGKSLLKKIPLIGAVAGVGFGLHRALKGDFAGALGEVASGIASTVPGLGTAASVAIDAGLAARDIKNATAEAEGEDGITADIEGMPIPAVPNVGQMQEGARQASAEVLETISGANAPAGVQNVTNNYNTTNNNNVASPASTGGGTGKTTVSVRDTHSSILRFQDRRLSRVV